MGGEATKASGTGRVIRLSTSELEILDFAVHIDMTFVISNGRAIIIVDTALAVFRPYHLRMVAVRPALLCQLPPVVDSRVPSSPSTTQSQWTS